jgi:monoterpene epsilon-lactone hydrolase
MPSIQGPFFRLLARLGSAYTDRSLARSLAELRRDSLRGPRVPRGTVVQPVSAAGVPCEWVSSAGQPPDPAAGRVVLYLHGGGWVLGWGATHRRLVAQLSRLAEARILAVDYRLAPEHPFPAGLEDCLAVYRWLLESGIAPESITIAGDSAGGNLTVSTMVAQRDSGGPLPAAAVCISPAVDLSPEQERVGILASGKDDPMISSTAGEFMLRAYVNGQDTYQPLMSPVFADLRGLPPMLIQVGEKEVLLGAATRLATRARAAGVDVTFEVWPGMWHVWHIFAPYLPEARQAIEHAASFVREHVRVPQ